MEEERREYTPAGLLGTAGLNFCKKSRDQFLQNVASSLSPSQLKTGAEPASEMLDLQLRTIGNVRFVLLNILSPF
jgi:hypothetical protein